MPAMLPELILDSIQRHRDKPAIVAGNQVVSYRELGDRARRIAAALSAHGIGHESVVGVLGSPGPGLVTALLGTWMAGACYVSIDPLAPIKRQASILNLAGAAALLSEHQVESSLAGGLPVVLINSPDVTDVAPANPAPPSRAAYMIFTSGSTGTPKGVVIEHAGIANRVLWGIQAFGLRAADRILQRTPITFDAAGWEIFTPLVIGGPVVFGRPGAERDPAAMVASLAETSATVLQIVPSLLRLLVAEPGLEECQSLRTVCAGGEPLNAHLCRLLRDRVDVEIWNIYGPAECSIDVTAHRFDPAQEEGPVPIGCPIDNMQVRLFPVDMTDPCPAGSPTPGSLYELYAAGPGVGRGYRSAPAQTAERFLPDPSGPPGTRMYRTGDLVRPGADGALTFVRRADAQFKVNGVRIEPGEVEAALELHPAVVTAAVAPVDDPHGVRRVGAWVVTTDGNEPADLQGFARERLPSPFVPTIVTVLAALPVTASGKIDRSRLPDPSWDRRPLHDGIAASVTTEEALVLAAWRDVLGVEEIGLDDDFFRLGGHSLLTPRIAAALTKASGVTPNFRELHFAATPRAQAQILANTAQEQPIEPLPEGARIPLSPSQERFWLQDRLSPGSAEYLVPVLLWFPADISERTLRDAVEKLAARHEPLRTRYVMDSQGLRADVLSAAEAVDDFAVVDTAPSGVTEHVRTALAKGFDLAAGSPIRYRLIRDGGLEQLLLIVHHHIAGDGWSSHVLERDLRAIVDADLVNSPVLLPQLPVRYQDAVGWQRKLLTSQVAAEQLAQWRTTLAGVSPLALPGAKTRPSHRTIDGGVVEVGIPPEAVEALSALARETGVSAYVGLLTLWIVLLARAGGTWDFSVGTPHLGRERPEFHDLVGLFMNVVVIRAKLMPDMSFRSAVAQVGQVCQEAFARSAVPFEQVAEAVEPVRDRSRTPVYQTIFSYSGDGVIGQRWRERDLQLLAESWRVAKTDIALALWPHSDGSLGGAIEYAVDVLPDRVARELAEELRGLAVAFAVDPGVRLGAQDRESVAAQDSVLESPLIAALLGFVRELLLQEDIGADDDVLQLGANSMVVARLLWNVQDTFGVEVPMHDFFDKPTVAALAAHVERLLQAEIDGGTVSEDPPKALIAE